MKRKTTVLLAATLALCTTAALLINNIALASEKTTNHQINDTQAGQVTALEPFFRLPAEQEAALKAIVMNDPQIKGLINLTEYDYHLDVGGILKKGTTAENLKAWLDGGQTDQNSIEQYVGVLYIGYNNAYTFTINNETNTVQNLVKQDKTGTSIPELTKQEKIDAIEIITRDPLLSSLLVNKDFIIGDEEHIGVWHSQDMQKLGVVIEVSFSQSFYLDSDIPTIDYDPEKYSFPYYTTNTIHHSGEVKRLIISINLEEGSIVRIQPLTD